MRGLFVVPQIFFYCTMSRSPVYYHRQECVLLISIPRATRIHIAIEVLPELRIQYDRLYSNWKNYSGQRGEGHTHPWATLCQLLDGEYSVTPSAVCMPSSGTLLSWCVRVHIVHWTNSCLRPFFYGSLVFACSNVSLQHFVINTKHLLIQLPGSAIIGRAYLGPFSTYSLGDCSRSTAPPSSVIRACIYVVYMRLQHTTPLHNFRLLEAFLYSGRKFLRYLSYLYRI